MMSNGPSPIIRQALPGDWRAVAALLEELGRPKALDIVEERAHCEHFATYLSRPDAEAFVAEIDGVVVGFVNVELRRRLNFLTPQGWIPELVVSELWHGRGIGRALLARAEAAAIQRDCWSITLESARWRHRAHAFYEVNGWVNGSVSFAKALAGVPWPPSPA